MWKSRQHLHITCTFTDNNLQFTYFGDQLDTDNWAEGNVLTGPQYTQEEITFEWEMSEFLVLAEYYYTNLLFWYSLWDLLDLFDAKQCYRYNLQSQ